MPESPQGSPTGGTQVPAQLHEAARLLREAEHLQPEERQSLADLADELARVLSTSPVPSTEELQLAELTRQLIQALHEQEDPAPLAATRHRLQEAILAADVKHPFAAGLARQLLDVLANLGI